ncbi:MAG: ECF transporter S component [Oscillospiraceae bacterium]
MKKIKAKTITTAGIIIALGVLIPQIFHLIGGKSLGNMLLPMHLPILIGGFILPTVPAMLCGIIAPIISSLLTGMPPMPRLIFMVFELAAYGFFTSLFFKKLKLNAILSLVLSMLCGRAVYFLSLVIAINILGISITGMTSAWAAVLAAVSTGIIGIIVQIIIIPIIVIALKKAGIINDRK